MLATGRSILFIVLTTIQVHSWKYPDKHLKSISNNNKIKPIVIYLNKGNREVFDVVNLFADNTNKEADKARLDFDDLLQPGAGDDGVYDEPEEQTLEETAREQAKYLLFNFLRTSPDPDPRLEDTKQVLRQALRARCKKVKTCVTECKVEKQSCPKKCKKIFDELDLCEPPKKECKKPRCGRTMPPKWSL